MKQRLTYLLPAGTGVELSDIQVDNQSLDFSKAGHASQEWRLTLGLHELPDELQSILEGCHELHLRWSSPDNHKLVPPLVSRLPPGLHAFFTPRKADEITPLCDLLNQLLGDRAKCYSVPESFAKISITSERFARTSTFQWHQFLSERDLSLNLAAISLGKVCAPGWGDSAWSDACDSLVDDLQYAASIDVDFDAISHAFTISVNWSVDGAAQAGIDSRRTPRKFRKAGVGDRLEVGVLQVEPAEEFEKLTLGGFLTVVGEDDHPSPTFFSFPSRHHPLPPDSPATFTASFQTPTGLHPKLQLRLPQNHLRPPRESCALHTYMTLPSALFIDRYQLSDPLFLKSQNLVGLRSLAGAHDLEAPDWVTTKWGSAALLRLATPSAPESASSAKSDWVVTVPLHLRYIDQPRMPTDELHEATIQVPWPIVFWACEAEEGLKMSTNPFDRVDLGYEGLFGPKTMFFHVPPAASAKELVEEIRVPILDATYAEWIHLGTFVAVVVGFAWICWKMLVPVGSRGQENRKEKKTK